MIIDSTNKVLTLQDDLMPFLEKLNQSNFLLDEEFPWIKDALQQIDNIYQENI